MKLLILRTLEPDASYIKNGEFFNIIDTDSVELHTSTSPVEAESIESFAESLGLTPYTYVAPPTPPRTVPSSIANWRAKAILSISGLLPLVDEALNSLSEPQKTIVLSAWNGGAEIHRNGPTVTAAIAILGLTNEQVDQLFIQASDLKV